MIVFVQAWSSLSGVARTTEKFNPGPSVSRLWTLVNSP